MLRVLSVVGPQKGIQCQLDIPGKSEARWKPPVWTSERAHPVGAIHFHSSCNADEPMANGGILRPNSGIRNIRHSYASSEVAASPTGKICHEGNGVWMMVDLEHVRRKPVLRPRSLQ